MLKEKATADIAFAEAGNVLWKHIKMVRISRSETTDRANLLRALINSSKVYRSDDLLSSSLELAINYDITIYDALFLSLAIQLDTDLVTTDRKLYEKLPPDVSRRIILIT